MRPRKHHRPKPRRLKRGENRRRVAYLNGYTGWARVAGYVIHGEARLEDILKAFRRKGVTIRFVVMPSGNCLPAPSP